jgi:hypothetical protein
MEARMSLCDLFEDSQAIKGIGLMLASAALMTYLTFPLSAKEENKEPINFGKVESFKLEDRNEDFIPDLVLMDENGNEEITYGPIVFKMGDYNNDQKKDIKISLRGESRTFYGE